MNEVLKLIENYVEKGLWHLTNKATCCDKIVSLIRKSSASGKKLLQLDTSITKKLFVLVAVGEQVG